MSSSSVSVGTAPSLEGQSGGALLDVVEQGLALLAACSLDEAGDPELTERVERLHRVETMAGAEKTCVGCGGPVSRSQIHRPRQPPPPTLKGTRDLGPTDEDNLCLVCCGCHFNIHHHGWEVVRDPDSGRFQPYPPAVRVGRRRAS